MSTPNNDLTPALFTDRELYILKVACRDADSNLAKQYLAAGLQRAAEMRAKKQAKEPPK